LPLIDFSIEGRAMWFARSRSRLTGMQLVLIVLLLVIQFALRTYHPLEQPAGRKHSPARTGLPV
jgi:hypothetical protein